MLKASSASLLMFSLVLSLAGCGKSDRPTLVQASGRVTLAGAPVAGATVSFQPVAGGRPCSGLTNANGVYTITSYEENDGAPVGEHKVVIIKIAGPGASAPAEAAPAEDPSLSLSTMEGPGDDGQPPKQPETQYLVPKKYSSPDTSGLTVQVPDGGSDQLDFDLSVN
ncbi:MAG: carboxypeptidase-like regulatory domain-containing protein [Planctomycetota bacterium]